MQSEQPQDGQYTAEVTLSGGSGRAEIQSPAEVTVEDGAIGVKIVWSSSHYDYMEVDGKGYLPTHTADSSVFFLENVALDQEIPVLAETTAMSQPHTIAYSILIHGDTLQSASSPLLAIGFCCAGAALLCAVSVSLWMAKKRKKQYENRS